MTQTGGNEVASSGLYNGWARFSGIMLYVLAALDSAVMYAVPDGGNLALLLRVMAATSATFWARYDAMSRDKPILPVLQMVYFFLWPIGAIVYLAARSGWRGFGTALLYGAGLLALMFAVAAATSFALHRFGMLDPRFYDLN